VAGVESEEPAIHREHSGEGEARAPLKAGGSSGVGYRASWDWIAASIAARFVAAFH
jgi:hypothetical protein